MAMFARLTGFTSAHYRSRLFVSVVFLFTVTFLFQSSAGASSETPRLWVWSEFSAPAQVEASFDALAATKTGLLLAVFDHQLQSVDRPEVSSFISLMKKAKEKGVRVRPWPLLHSSDGYWPNAWNLPQYIDFVEEMLKQMKAQGVTPEMISIDLEPPRELTLELQSYLQKFKLKAALRFLRKKRAECPWEERRDMMRTWVHSLQERGIKVHAVVQSFILDDLVVGHQQFQRSTGVIFEGVKWDYISAMVYRPEFINMVGKIKADIVYSYAATLRKHFGRSAAIDLGEVGDLEYPFPIKGYHSVKPLLEDVHAATLAGLSNVHVYSMEGIQSQGDLQEWTTKINATLPPSESEDSALKRWSTSWKTRWLRGFLQWMIKKI